jgi:hypothetical protein
MDPGLLIYPPSTQNLWSSATNGAQLPADGRSDASGWVSVAELRTRMEGGRSRRLPPSELADDGRPPGPCARR